MIDASTSMLETISKSTQFEKANLKEKSTINDEKGFSGYMDKSSKNTPSKAENSSPSSKQSSANEKPKDEEFDEQAVDGTPVANSMVEPADPAREKVANLLLQRASILQKLSNRQDGLVQKQLAAVEEVLDFDRMDDDLISQFIEKLNLDKSKGELNFHTRLMAEKNLANLDSVETGLNRLVADNGDKNALLTAVSQSERLNSLTSLPTLKLSTPVNSSEWGLDLGKRIQMLMKNNIQQADIRLDPPEMGRIHIRINMSQDQANVTFSAMNTQVRDAIENSMTRLRDMLGETGLQLGDANVASEFQQQTHQSEDNGAQFSNTGREAGRFEGSAGDDLPSVVIQHSIDGVIDYFA